MDKIFKFNKIFSGSSSSGGGGGSGWLLDGNTVGSEKFIGTLDNYAFPIRINNSEVARFNTSGNFLLGNPTATGRRLDVKQGSATNSFGELVGASGWAAWYVNQSSPSSTNYFIATDGGSGTFAASTQHVFYTGGVARTTINATGLLLSSGVKIGTDGNTPTSIVDIGASTTSAASLRIRSGSAPTTPNNGDVWFNSSNQFNFQGNGVFSGGLLINGATATGQPFDLKSGSNSWTFGSSTQYSNFAAMYINTTSPSNSNWIMRSDGSGELDINAPNRLTLLVNNDNIGLLYSDKLELGLKASIDNGNFFTPTAILDLGASTTSNASLRIRSGTAPTSPNDGDIWYDGTDLKMRVGGTTKTFTLT